MSEQKLYIPTGNPELSGCWGPTKWEFHVTTEMPDMQLITAAGCVAVRGRNKQETMLTLNTSNNPVRRGKYEVPFGHLDPIDPEKSMRQLESPWTAAKRELTEEVGARPGKLYPFGVRKIFNPPVEERPVRYKDSPDITYMQYFVTAAQERIFMPTDPEHTICGTFLLGSVRNMCAEGLIDETEYRIIELGMEQYQRIIGSAS